PRPLVQPPAGVAHARVAVEDHECLEQARLERTIVVHVDNDIALRGVEAYVALEGRTGVARHVAELDLWVSTSQLCHDRLGGPLRISVVDGHLAFAREGVRRA